MKVVELKPEPCGNMQTIRLLSSMLDRAKNGEFIGCAIVAIKSNNDLAWDYTTHVDKHKTIGALEMLKLDIAGAIK